MNRLLESALVREVGGSGQGRQTPGVTRYAMHPLVQEFAIDMFMAHGQQEQTDTYAAFASYMLSHVEGLIGKDPTAASSSPAQVVISEELQNIRALARKLVEVTQEGATGVERRRCCEVTNIIQQHESELKEAELIMRAELEAQEKALGTTHEATVSSRSKLAAILQARGKLREAEKVQQHVVDALQKETGAESSAAVRARADLARIQAKRRGCGGRKAADPQLGSHVLRTSFALAALASAALVLWRHIR